MTHDSISNPISGGNQWYFEEGRAMMTDRFRSIVDKWCKLNGQSIQQFSILIGREPHWGKKIFGGQWSVHINDLPRIRAVLGEELSAELDRAMQIETAKIKRMADEESEKLRDRRVAVNIAKIV